MLISHDTQALHHPAPPPTPTLQHHMQGITIDIMDMRLSTGEPDKETESEELSASGEAHLPQQSYVIIWATC